MTSSGDLGSAVLIYVGDTMCSWCWGFAPTLHRLEKEFALPVRVINGGLRPGPYAEPLNDGMAANLGRHWRNVARSSGQPFDHSFLGRRDGWRFDTEVPAIAVTAMRKEDRDSAFPFFTDIQYAFFADGIDITDLDHYEPLVAPYPVDSAPFLEYLTGDEARDAAWRDFAAARSLGVSSFPALLLRTEARVATVVSGWQTYEQTASSLRALLSDSPVEGPEGEACPVDSQ